MTEKEFDKLYYDGIKDFEDGLPIDPEKYPVKEQQEAYEEGFNQAEYDNEDNFEDDEDCEDYDDFDEDSDSEDSDSEDSEDIE